MKLESKTRSPRLWEIAVESDWITTAGATVLLLVCCLLLVREIDHFIWHQLSRPAHIHGGFWSIWNKVSEAMTGICCFLAAFTLPKKSVKIACALMGIDFAGFALLSFFHTSSGLLRIAAVGGSAARQVALAIFCMALAQWLRSVVHRDSQSELPGGES